MKIGVALSSGGVKGFAHIGVLKVLEKNFDIKVISGCSAGAIVASFFAVYGSIKKLEENVLALSKKELNELLDITFPFGGIIEGKKIYERLKKYLKNRTFKQTKIPLRIVATDIVKGKEVVFKSGEIAAAVRASIGIPGVFKKFRYKNMILVDGGVLDPLPIKIIQKESDFVIGSSLNAIFEDKSMEKSNLIKDIDRAIEIMEWELTKEKLKDVKNAYIINVNKKGELENFSYEKIREFIKVGEKRAKAALPKIKKAIREAGLD